ENVWGWQGLLEATWEAEASLPGTPDTIESSLMFAPPIEGDRRIPPGRPLLVRSRLDAELPREGVEWELGVIVDDVAFEEVDASTARYGASHQRLRAGAVADVEGETTSGVKLSSQTGWCYDPDARFSLVDGSISGEVCPSGELAWSKTTLAIDDFPVSPATNAEAELECEAVDMDPPIACELDAEATLTPPAGGPFAILVEEATVGVDYDDIYPERELDDVEIKLVHRPIEMTWTLDESLAWDRLNVEGKWAIRRDDVVLTWDFYSTFEPNDGLTYLRLGGDMERGPLEAGADVRMREADDGVRVDELATSIVVKPRALPLELAMDATFDVDGLDEVELGGSLAF
ncbi:MAG: hypothetical protein ABEK03_02415, partial [Candidatus Bipolaricaulia bacterium]